jgi:hypothetical protein
MHDYAALKAMVTRHKAALTRAKKKGPEAVITACKDAYEDFDNGLWPDSWHTWKIAEEDALMEIRRRTWKNTHLKEL